MRHYSSSSSPSVSRLCCCCCYSHDIINLSDSAKHAPRESLEIPIALALAEMELPALRCRRARWWPVARRSTRELGHSPATPPRTSHRRMYIHTPFDLASPDALRLIPKERISPSRRGEEPPLPPAPPQPKQIRDLWMKLASLRRGLSF